MSKVDDWPTLTDDDLVSTKHTMSSCVNYDQIKYK